MAAVKVFGQESPARTFGQAVDEALGLPRNEDPAQGGLGERVGGGRHGPWPVTEHYESLYLGPGGVWWHPVDTVIQGLHGQMANGITIDASNTVDRDLRGRPIENPSQARRLAVGAAGRSRGQT